MKNILVTGAYGYIGSHTVKVLAEHGYSVTAVDIKESSNDISRYCKKIIINDITNDIWNGRYEHVVHLAGLIAVEESVSKPWLYTKNNVIGTKNILEKTYHYDDVNVTFASTAAAFNPLSPYAYTKILAEELVKEKADNYTIFRFFNVAGNDGEFKQIGKATHLIRIAAEVAAGKRPFINIFGTDWETRDGTAIRDYVHVSDLVECIVYSLENPSNSNFECIGSGIGHTVKEVIEMMKEVSGKDFEVYEAPRRNGDSAELIMPKDKSVQYYSRRTLEEMCLSAYLAELR